jgi:hypothetical protein
MSISNIEAHGSNMLDIREKIEYGHKDLKKEASSIFNYTSSNYQNSLLAQVAGEGSVKGMSLD